MSVLTIQTTAGCISDRKIFCNIAKEELRKDYTFHKDSGLESLSKEFIDSVLVVLINVFFYIFVEVDPNVTGQERI